MSAKLPEVLVLPVSGHGTIEQLGILSALMKKKYKPKVSLGASGGAITAALAIAFDWDCEAIFKWLTSIDSDEILGEKFLGAPISALTSISMYEVGQGLDVVFKYIARPEFSKNFRNQELIISAQNQTLGRLEIFSTVSSENSILHGSKGSLNIFGTSCFISFLGDIPDDKVFSKKLEKVVRATSAVPMVFPPVEIDGSFYIDGGVGFSSPLAPFMGLVKGRDVLYIFPEDIDEPKKHRPQTAFDSLMAYFAQVSRSNYIHDRSTYLSGLCCGDFKRLGKIHGNSSDLENLLKKTNSKKRFVELFPTNNSNSMPILSRPSKKEMITRLYENFSIFSCRIYAS